MKKLIFALLFCSLGRTFAQAAPTDVATKSINGDEILNHIRTLSSDEFEGRSPGTKGESLSVDYITDQFKKMGLAPGNPDGTYREEVPLVGITGQPSMKFKTKQKEIDLKFPDEFVAFSPEMKSEFEIKKSDLVFVGYGVLAPEYNWDDYKGVDLHGKTIVMLINDPAIPDPKNPKELDPKMFKGKAMTYYGRWTYKFEMAIKMGAVAAIIVHETEAAAYPYEVVKNSWSRANFQIQSDGPSKDFPRVASWIHLDKAKELFRASGFDFDTLKKSALTREFKPVSLGSTVDIKVKNTWEKVNSTNVVGKIEGADPKLKSEYVIYSAHWDHFGINEKLPGPKVNQVFHGALDNASGIAMILEIAQAYKKLKTAPKRTILFIATTAEERGLLGARYYARNPLYPLNKTLVDINIDGANVWGRTKLFEIVGYGKSDVDQIAKKYTAKQGRKIAPEETPEFGSFYRADHFEFAKVGVPVLYGEGGISFIGKPNDYAKQKRDEFIGHDYHKVTDVIKPDWDMSGAVEDAQLFFLVGYDIAQGKKYPKWNNDDEFKVKRDESLKQ